MISSKERVTRALYLEEAPDRLPFGEWEIQGSCLRGIIGRDPVLYNNLALYELISKGKREEFIRRQIEDLVDLVKKLEIDIVWVHFAPAESWRGIRKTGEFKYELSDRTFGRKDWGAGRVVIEWNPDSETFWEVETSLNSAELLEEYVGFHEQSQDVSIDLSTLELIEKAVKKVGDRVFVCAAADGTFPFLLSPTTMPIFLKCQYTHPSLVKRLLREHSRRQIEYGKAAIDAGVSAVLMNADYCSKTGPFMSPKQFRDFYLPEIKAHHDAYHKKGAFVIQHKDGNIWLIADALLIEAEADAYQAMEPSADMKLSEMKAAYGEKICLMGNVDCVYTLVHGTADEVAAETADCIKAGAPGGAYIVSSSNVVVSRTPTENYLALVETVKKKGRCPLNL